MEVVKASTTGQSSTVQVKPNCWKSNAMSSASSADVYCCYSNMS